MKLICLISDQPDFTEIKKTEAGGGKELGTIREPPGADSRVLEAGGQTMPLAFSAPWCCSRRPLIYAGAFSHTQSCAYSYSLLLPQCMHFSGTDRQLHQVTVTEASPLSPSGLLSSKSQTQAGRHKPVKQNQEGETSADDSAQLLRKWHLFLRRLSVIGESQYL